MTTLRPDEAAAVAGLFPDEPSFAVLEARTGEAFWYEVYPRPWAPGGVTVQLAPAPPPAGPVAAVVPPGDVPPWLREALTAVADRSPLLLSGEPGGLITRDGRPVTAPPRPPAQLHLGVEGVGRVEQLVSRLPAVVRVVVPAAEGRRFVRIDGHPVRHLPPPAWFYLHLPPGPADLEVGVAPGRSGDKWALAAGGREVGTEAEPAEPAPVRRVILVVDRTCPDRDKWEAARDLVRSDRPAGPRQLEAFKSGAPAAAAPAEAPQADLNAAIRSGLADGFRTAFPDPVEVELVWFADVTDGGLGRPERATLAGKACGQADHRCRSDAIDRILPAAGYAPGLDVCDALEEGVREAGRIARETGPAAVLIVGNSPPRRPTDPDHPFSRMWSGVLPRSSSRSRGQFPAALADLDRLGCPVVALFLVGHLVPPGFDAYGPLQAAVGEAFRRTMPVETAVADRAGVAAGVVAAVRRLEAVRSGVLVERRAP